MNQLITRSYFSLKTRFYTISESQQENITYRWVWFILALVVILAVAAYAFYCTSKGYSFSLGAKIHWPRFWQGGIRCSR